MTLLELLDAQIALFNETAPPMREHVANCATCKGHLITAKDEPDCVEYRQRSRAAEKAQNEHENRINRAHYAAKAVKEISR